MPNGFRFLYDTDLWKPLRMGGSYAGARRFHNWVMVGRLRPGARLAQAQQEAEAAGTRLEAAYPDSNEGKSFRFDPLRAVLTETSRSQLGLLVAAVALLLVISSGNVAGLLLVRGAGRRQELAIRAALGAPRRRLISQLLTEGVLLALAAGIVGLVAAQFAASALLQLLPLDALGIERLSVNPTVAIFALVLSVVTAALFTLAPSLRASRLHPGRELTGTRSTDSRGTARLRAGLVVAQIALTVVLLAGAGLLVRSLAGLQADDLGFDGRRLVAAEIQLPRGERSEEEARFFFGQLLERTRLLVGVEAAALISQLPVRDPGNNLSVQRAEDFNPARPGDGPLGYIRSVFPGYFATLGIPLVSGRDVAATDTSTDPLVAVLNRRLAQLLFEDEDPVGREIAVDAGGGAIATVIGVVGNVKINGPGSEDAPVFYFPATQWTPATMRLAVRTAGNGSAIAASLRGLLAELDPEIPIDRVETMQGVIRSGLGQRRVTTAALILFATAALTLAAIGLYGVLAEGVLQRRREIGVRMALGAARQRVVGLVVGRAALMVGTGLAIGLLAALSLSRIVADLLYEVSPYDPTTLALVALTLGVFAVLAAALPAMRASRIDPAIALRGD
jgi:predicted permease